MNFYSNPFRLIRAAHINLREYNLICRTNKKKITSQNGSNRTKYTEQNLIVRNAAEFIAYQVGGRTSSFRHNGLKWRC